MGDEALVRRVKLFARHPTDTGSPEVQVAALSERVRHLTSHLASCPKDLSCRRGLVALVNNRRRLLNYLCGSSPPRYAAVVQSLNLRHKDPLRVLTKAERYSKFTNTKAGPKPKKKKKKGRTATGFGVFAAKIKALLTPWSGPPEPPKPAETPQP